MGTCGLAKTVENNSKSWKSDTLFRLAGVLVTKCSWSKLRSSWDVAKLSSDVPSGFRDDELLSLLRPLRSSRDPPRPCSSIEELGPPGVSGKLMA